jgi:adenosylcobinamide-GDP ribazoletransferase
VVGALAGTAGWGASLLVPRLLSAAVALAVAIVLTGAIHLDGFLDGCDALFAGATLERRLEILKDPRHGTFAVAGMFVIGSLWLAALTAIAPRAYPAILAFTGALARAAVVPNALFFPHAAPSGPSAAFVAKPPMVPIVATLLLLTAAGYMLAPPLAAAVPLALLASWLVARSIAARLGGLVGDAYGFTIVLLEVGLLCAVAAGAGPGGG